MKKIFLLITLIAACCGCATKTVPLAPNTLEKFRGKTIACAVPPPPSFTAMHGGWSLLGFIGGVANTIKGDQLVRENGISDPAQKSCDALVSELAAAYNLTVLPPIQHGHSLHCKADLVLETRTTYWGFGCFLTDWKNYFVTYRSAVRLIDPRTGTCLAAGEARIDNRDYAPPRSYDDLTGNQATGLKAELDTAQKKAAEKLRQIVFVSK